jgi:hypothetical protein
MAKKLRLANEAIQSLQTENDQLTSQVFLLNQAFVTQHQQQYADASDWSTAIANAAESKEQESSVPDRDENASPTLEVEAIA